MDLPLDALKLASEILRRVNAQPSRPRNWQQRYSTFPPPFALEFAFSFLCFAASS